jgi:uncharacterized membrane protein
MMPTSFITARRSGVRRPSMDATRLRTVRMRAFSAVVYYLYMFGLAALLAFDPFSRGLRLAAVAYSTLGTCFSIYFMYLQIAFIHAFCIYCLVSAVTTLLLFIAALSHFRATRANEVIE